MVIPDLYPLKMWLACLNAGPGLSAWPFCATSSTISQGKLVLNTVGNLIDNDKIVVKVELFDGWKVSLLRALKSWRAWLWVSPAQFVGGLVLNDASEDSLGKLTHLGSSLLSQLDNRHSLAKMDGGSTIQLFYALGNDIPLEHYHT